MHDILAEGQSYHVDLKNKELYAKVFSYHVSFVSNTKKSF